MFDSICFILTDKCTAACKMCCLKCNTNNEVFLETNFIKKVVDEVRGTKIRTVLFSGGEPFLHQDLLELIAYCKGDFKVTLCTNGFFAKNEKIAYDVLKQLEEAGLNHVTISTDTFHQEYVPLSTIKNFLYSCNRTRLTCTLGISVLEKDFETDTTIKYLRNALFDTTIQFNPILPIGSGKELTGYFVSRKRKNMQCIYGRQLAILSNKKVYPCCSQAVFETCLSLGDMNLVDLEQVFVNARKHILLNMLLQKGFDYVLAKLERHGVIIDNFVHECHLCNLIFSNDKNVDILLNDFDIPEFNILDQLSSGK